MSEPDPFRDHGTADRASLDRALAIVRYLRAHCPWDAKQTPRSLVPHLVEESLEVVEALRSNDAGALRGELGDLLLNLAFQIVIAEENSAFTPDEVVRELEEKMVRRHPHLFGKGEAEPWEAIKSREGHRRDGVLDGLVEGLDPLLRAHRIQEKVSQVGFDWSEPGGAAAKVREEMDEVLQAIAEEDGDAIEEELGDLLFSVVNLARLLDGHAHDMLDRANRKFERRFRALEVLARERDVELGAASLEELDRLWDAVKASEANDDISGTEDVGGQASA